MITRGTFRNPILTNLPPFRNGLLLNLVHVSCGCFAPLWASIEWTHRFPGSEMGEVTMTSSLRLRGEMPEPHELYFSRDIAKAEMVLRLQVAIFHHPGSKLAGSSKWRSR